MTGQSSPLMTTREVAELLRVTPECLKVARTRGTKAGGIPPLPYIRLGRNIRYERDKVMAILAESVVNPRP